MAGVGRISVFASKDLQRLVVVAKRLPKEVAKQIRKQTKDVVMPEWREAVRGRVTTRLQTRVLSDTARAAVSNTNVQLRSAHAGRTHGVPNSVLAGGAEFGADPNAQVWGKSKHGKYYKRRRGRIFLPRRRRGYVVYEAAANIIPRIVSLWMQTAARTVAEEFEKGAR